MSKKGRRDIYEVWKDSGDLPRIIEFIKDCSRKLISQTEMCKYLGIEDETFCRLKKRHPDLAVAQKDAKLNLKKDLCDALLKKALGYETVEEEQFIEDGGKGKEQKRKIHRIKKQVPADYKSIVYLLTKHFGIEYSERYEEMLITQKKLEASKEEWDNGESNDSAEED